MLNLKEKYLLPALCFYFMFNFELFAQTNSPDNILNTKLQLAKDLVYSDARRSKKLAKTEIKLSKKQNNLIYEAAGWNIKGIIKYFISSPDTALQYFIISEQLGLKANDKLSIAKAKQNKNLPLSQMGKYDLALQTCLDAVKLYEELGNLQAQAACLGDIGNILIQQSRPTDAIAYLKEAISISKRLNNEAGRANFFNSLGIAYAESKQPHLALETYSEALKLAEKFNNIKNQISININMGEFVWEIRKDAIQSLNYFQKAEKLAIEYGDNPKLSIVYQNMGVIYNARGNPSKALEFALKARDLSIETKQIYALEKIYSSIANYSSSSGNYKEALLAYASKDSLSRIIFNETNNKNLNEIRTKYESEKKDYSINLLEKQNQIQALQIGRNNLLLSNNELELKANRLLISNQQLNMKQQKDLLIQKQLEATTKEQKIKILDAENQLQKLQLIKRNITMLIVFGVMILLMVITILLYNRHKIKQKAQLQSEVIRQQDIAAKAIIQAEENERQRIARELHDGLGQLFSAVKMNLSGISESLKFKDKYSKEIFDTTINMVDESCKEVRVISHQMAPNVLLKSGLASAIRDFISKFDARKLKINLETFGLQERLDLNTEAVLYRVIQESVNNVIKHSGATILDIQLSRDEDGINAMIEDNGIGFMVQTSDTISGMGLKNIISRVNYLKGSVDVSSEPGKGTLVAIHIPL